MQDTVSVVANLWVSRFDSSLYGYTVEVDDTVLFDDAGFTSITDALADAAKSSSKFIGLQVGYAGLVAGTYAPSELLQNCDAVAQLCVRNAGRFNPR